MKPNYFVIPLIVLATAVSGSWITGQGLAWYGTVNLPAIAPAGSFIGGVWTVIFILSAIAALLFWNKKSKKGNYRLIAFLFVLNAALNVFWSSLFFGQHLLGWAIVEMIALNLVNLTLIVLLWKKHLWSAILLLPYFLWVSFATYLAYLIWSIN